MRYEKLAPGLTTVFHDYTKNGPATMELHRRALGVFAARAVNRPPRLSVFIRCAHTAKLDHLSKFDIRVTQATGAVRTCFLPVSGLEPLTEEQAVTRIIPAQRLRPLMDVATTAIHIPALRSRRSSGGRGVIVGVVDTGIDARHPAFAGRVLAVWDQTAKGEGVVEGQYGVELTGARLSDSVDTVGHGTHVAGIAAGADGAFGGVAPNATVVAVKTDLDDTHIADGITYIFRLARERGMPAVVNLSLGGHYDAHDGTDALSTLIDEQSGPGRLVCCAAGNEGNDNIHGQAVIAPLATYSMRFRVPTQAVRAVVLNGWYAGGHRLEVAIRTPGRFVPRCRASSRTGRLRRPTLGPTPASRSRRRP